MFFYTLFMSTAQRSDEVQLETNTGEGDAGWASTAELQVGAVMKGEVILVCRSWEEGLNMIRSEHGWI